MHNANQDKSPTPVVPVRRMIGGILFLSLFTLTVLSGCGGGADSKSKPGGREEETNEYVGPKENTDDVRAFKQELWEKLNPSSVCGRCHRSDAEPASRQAPYFVEWADVNVAYDIVVNGNLVDLTNPAESVLVQRVAGGHQCWLTTASQCEAAMISYIEAWANSSEKGETNVQVQIKPLNDGQIRDPGQSLFFPVEPPASYFTDGADESIHTLVSTYCSACHISTARNAQSPYFAEADVDASYQAIKTVVNLNDPAKSRVYERLLADHNCWDTCADNAAEMLKAIQNLADSLTITGFDPDDAVSKALTMVEGYIASSGNRYEASQIALYEFKSGSRDENSRTIEDTSGVAPAINLNIVGTGHRWLSNWGLEFSGSRALASVEDSRKLYNLIRLTGEYSVEAWVIPNNINQENATIIAYSGGATERNFAMGQTMYNYDFYQRSSTIDSDDGQPKLMTNDDDQDLQATLQHVVITYDRNSGRRIYVNGEFTDDDDTEEAGDLLNWHPSYILSFGNELSNNRTWAGILRMVAIHDRSLTPDQIRQNYAAEVGQKYLVPFNVSHLLDDDTPHSYVVFEVNQFDEYSYLFRNPRFINVDPDSPDYIPEGKGLRGLRIGMNGQDVSVGQAYNHVVIDDLSEGYSPETGLLLSEIDTVIQIQNGSTDEFFLTFEQLGDKTYNFTENDKLDLPPLPTVPDESKPSDIGIRTFDEINASMAQMTGIDNWQDVTDINRVFTTYRQQLPAVENIETFLSSHQMATAQLAMSYCSELVNREGDTGTYFTDFDFTLKASEAFNSDTKVKRIVDPLLLKMLNVKDLTTDGDPNLATQPAVSTVRQEVNKLINDGENFTYPPTPAPDDTDNPNTPRIAMTKAACMTEPVPANNCDNANRTRQIVKATCAAVLGSAVMLIQ